MTWPGSYGFSITYYSPTGGESDLRKKSADKYAKWGYIFSVPFLVAFLVFSLYPLLYTIIISFTDLKGIATKDFNFLPNLLQNYIDAFKTPAFTTSLKNTVKIWGMNFIPQIVLSLVLAVWFTGERMRIKGAGLFKVLFYMPNIITAASIAILFSAFFGAPVGPVNDILMRLGLIDQPFYFFRSPIASQGIVAFIQFWMWYGSTMIVLIAGINGISPSIFEAAAIDGASAMQTFFSVTLPSLRPILLYTLITSFVGGMQMFDIPRLLIERSGPDNATLTTSVYIYNQAFSGSYMFNRAAAASMILFLIIAVCAAILFYVMRDKDAEALKKIQKARIKADKQARRAKA